MIPPHSQVRLNDPLTLRCEISIRPETGKNHSVNWVLMPTTPEYDYSYDEDGTSSSSGSSTSTESPAVALETLVEDGFVAEGNPRKLKASVRYEWDAVTNFNVEEHYLKIERVQTADQGLYICQVGQEESISVKC